MGPHRRSASGYVEHSIFKELTSKWGTFIRVDEHMMHRERPDIVRVLVRVKSKLDIPPLAKVYVGDVCHSVLVSIDGKADLEEGEIDEELEN